MLGCSDEGPKGGAGDAVAADPDGPWKSGVEIPAEKQKQGDPELGRTILLNGGYMGCGIPTKLLNNPLAIEAAQGLADRVQAEAGDDPERQIVRAFSWTLQREPTADELRACCTFLESQPLPALCRGLINLNEFVWID